MRQTVYTIKTFPTRAEMGKVAAIDVATTIKKLLETKETIRMIFAAAPSQSDFLAEFTADPSIDFSRIHSFHMDEYIGLPSDAPQGFGNFLKREIFGKVNFASVSYLNGNAEDIDAECDRYTALLHEAPIDIVCMGIGENGHIAFNDPPVADLHDTKTVKVVKLDEVCRNQQVNDGCFKTIDDVPTHALSLTVPALVNADYHFCIVPTALKANAVHDAVYGEIGEHCPATALRLCKNMTLYLDEPAASKL